MQRLKIFLQLGVSALCLIMLVIIVPFDQLPKTLNAARIAPLTAVFLLMPLAVFVRAWRWRYLLFTKNIVVPILTMYKLTFIGMALNLLLPGTLGDVARSYYGWRTHGNKEAMLASAIVDKVVALFTLCLLGIICAMAVSQYQLALVTTLFTVPIAVILFIPQLVPWHFLVFLFRKILRKDIDIKKLNYTFSISPKVLFISVMISLIGWSITNLMYYFSCLTFTGEMSIVYIFAVAPLINLTRILPVTISGLGSVDLLIVFLFSLVGIAASDAFMASIVIDFALIALPGLIGAFLIISLRQLYFAKASKNLKI